MRESESLCESKLDIPFFFPSFMEFDNMAET